MKLMPQSPTSVSTFTALSSIKRSTLQRKWCSSQRQQLSVVHVGTSKLEERLRDVRLSRRNKTLISRLFEDLKDKGEKLPETSWLLQRISNLVDYRSRWYGGRPAGCDRTNHEEQSRDLLIIKQED